MKSYTGEDLFSLTMQEATTQRLAGEIRQRAIMAYARHSEIAIAPDAPVRAIKGGAYVTAEIYVPMESV